MKLALITPIGAVADTDLCPDLRMCIASIAARSDVYRRFFSREVAKQKPLTIMDNGAFEGGILTEEELIELALEMDPHVLIAPDIINGDHCENAAKQVAFIRKAKAAGIKSEFMFVPQMDHHNHQTAQSILIWAAMQHEFAYIGISRFFANKACFEQTGVNNEDINRFALMHSIAAPVLKILKEDKKIHFLGAGSEWFLNGCLPCVYSMDTASLYWGSLEEVRMNLGIFPTLLMKRPENYFDLPTDILNRMDRTILEYNVIVAQRILNPRRSNARV